MARQPSRLALALLLGCVALAIYVGKEAASSHPPRWLEAINTLFAPTAEPPPASAAAPRSVLSLLPDDPTLAATALGDFPNHLPSVSNLLADPDTLEGLGGTGIHRAARRAGVWFPLFSPGKSGADADPDDAQPAALPLYITSGTPPATPPNEPVQYRFEAIGGQPPYRWRMVLGVEGFSIDPTSGRLTGQHAETAALPLAIHVTDAAGAQDSALYTLRIGTQEPLTLLTSTLPTATLGIAYDTTLTATGGSEPYSWSTDTPLPDGFFLDPSSGQLSGLSTAQGFAAEITFRVTDATDQEASAVLDFTVQSTFEIATPSPLPPAAPGSPYQLDFTTTGGTAPFAWRVIEGQLPPDWTLSENGHLSGTAPLTDSSHRFLIEATDAAGWATQKAFTLPIRRSLVVVPSLEKAGLAWQPREIARALGTPVRTVTVTRSLSPDGSAPVPVYQGRGSNFVDRGLTTGSTYYYTLHVHVPGSAPVAFASTAVTLLPFTKGRGTPGRLADPHADAVRLFRPLSPNGHGAAFAPTNVTGPPDGRGTFSPASDPAQVLSLHARAAPPGSQLDAAGGSIVLAFEDNIIDISPGEDFTVFENVFFINGDANQRFMEPAIVSVALFEGEWHRFPIDVVPPASTSSTPPTMDPFYYNRGFAGRNATTGGDPTDPRQSGGDSFNISDLKIPGLTWVRYIKIQSTGHQALKDDFGGHPVQHNQTLGATSGTGSSGFDLDAVTAVHY
jgi:hypothetical protein